MCPTRDLDHVTVSVEVLVDGVRIGDEVAGVAFEQLVDGQAVVRAGIAVKHLFFGGY